VDAEAEAAGTAKAVWGEVDADKKTTPKGGWGNQAAGA
jgi:hypothetical protein